MCFDHPGVPEGETTATFLREFVYLGNLKLSDMAY